MDDEEMDFLYDTIDAYARNNDFSAIDNLLQMIKISESSVDLILTFLTVTFSCKSKLKYRSTFFEESEQKLGAELVKGLE